MFPKKSEHLPRNINITKPMPRPTSLLAIFAVCLLSTCQNPAPSANNSPVNAETDPRLFVAIMGTPVLDGSGSDELWEMTEWLPISHLWDGVAPQPDDFSGRYKLAWDENNLYILAEITDDTLVDGNTQALEQFWDADCLVIFLDEDASGGEHEFNYNAFAYHIALDGRVTDVAPDSTFRFFDEHCLSQRITRDKVSTWEIAVRIFDGQHVNNKTENIPKLLKKGKKMGFALTYCDNDRSPERESFIGNVPMPDAGKNRPWLNADHFGVLELR